MATLQIFCLLCCVRFRIFLRTPLRPTGLTPVKRTTLLDGLKITVEECHQLIMLSMVSARIDHDETGLLSAHRSINGHSNVIAARQFLQRIAMGPAYAHPVLISLHPHEETVVIKARTCSSEYTGKVVKNSKTLVMLLPALR